MALVGGAIVVCVIPGAGRALEYDRDAVLAAQPWRLLTSQLAHWTPRMALYDLAVLLGVGAWLERRSRVLASAVLFAGALAVAAVLLADTGMLRYRGASGLVSAVVAAAAVSLVRWREGWPRWVAAFTIVAFAGKIAVELWTGTALFADAIQAGIAVRPAVHGAAALAGAAVALARPWRTPDADSEQGVT